MIYGTFLVNLTLTIFIEGLVIVLLFRRLRFVYYSFLCNIITNPALNLILLAIIQCLGAAYYRASLIILESAAVFVEAYVMMLLSTLSFKKALAVSALMNSVSCIIGILLHNSGILWL